MDTLQNDNNLNTRAQLKCSIILVQDPVDKGFTAFFAELPNIMAEGDTKEEARENLFRVASEVFEYKRTLSLNNNDLIKNDQYLVTVEDFNAELVPA